MPDDIQPGHVGWVDLTVDNATEVRDFYRAVVGWEYRDVEMDGVRRLRDDQPRGT